MNSPIHQIRNDRRLGKGAIATCPTEYPCDEKCWEMNAEKMLGTLRFAQPTWLIQQRADRNQPHMGLKTWKNAPKGKILKTDVSVAKNYLDEKELDELNHIVVMYLDYAELQAKRQRLMKMSDWVEKSGVMVKTERKS